MPEQFDPDWEYWQPSEEWTEAFECQSSLMSVVDGFQVSDQPNGYRSRLGPEKPIRELKGKSTLFLSPREEVVRTKVRPDISCAACRRLFHPRDSEAKCCSVECYKKHRKESAKTVVCGNCNQSFKPQRLSSLYCSKPCFYEGRKAKNKKVDLER